jgi:Uma2 family endonuclease
MSTTNLPAAAPAETQLPIDWTVADLENHLGVPSKRIRLFPWPGQATEQDVIALNGRTDRLYELIDGVLVEKVMGYYESRLAVLIATALQNFVDLHDLGVVLGADGAMRILPNQVRAPDVCFIAWQRFPNRAQPREPIPALVPDLAVEVLSDSNTERELQRKLQDYFTAGVQLVWHVDSQQRAATVYTAVDQPIVLNEDGTLDGGSVLPGFQLVLRELFEKAGRRQ